MSRIDKLQLRGIRAFDPGPIEEIRFGTPLTLIVGHNGSGKTTIIESLKYATSGIMPPTSKARGGEVSFLHDPDLCGERETAAQVKLTVGTSNGASIIGTRNMSLSVKKNKLTYATGTCTIKVARDGEISAETITVAAMNAQMTAWLGVSSAVLDKVIFCHQDESLWPLLPAKDLKPHFDELFEISKYADVIQTLKQVRNKQKDNLIGFKKDQEHYKVRKTEAVKAQKQTVSLHNDVEKLRVQVEECNVQSREALQKSDDALRSAQASGESVSTLKGKRIEMQTKQQYIDGLRRNLVELEDSDEALEDMLSKYEERVQQYQAEHGELQAHQQTLQQQITQSRSLLGTKEREAGANEAQYESHMQQVMSRKTLVKEMAQRHEIRGFGLDSDDGQIERFMDRLSAMAREQTIVLEESKRNTRLELQDIQKKLDAITGNRATLNARKENARQTIQSTNRKIEELQKQYNAVDVDEGIMSTLQAALERVQSNLGVAKTSVQQSDWSSAMRSVESELRSNQETKVALEEQLNKATESLQDSTQLDLARKDLDETEQRLRTMMGAHNDRLRAVLLTNLDPATADRDFETSLQKAALSLQESQTAQSHINRELENIEAKLETRRADYESGQTAVNTAAAAIGKVMVGGPEVYDTELQDLEEARSTVQADAAIANEMLKWFQQCLKDAAQHKVCRTCTRALKEKELEVFNRSVERQQKRYSSDAIAKELQEAESQLLAVKGVSSHVETWKHWTESELPALQAEIKQLERQRETVSKRLEAEDMLVSERASTKRDVEAVAKTVAAISKLYADSALHKQKIERLEARLAGVGIPRGLKEISDEREKINLDERNIRVKLEKIRSDKEKAEKAVSALQLELGQAQNRLETADRELKHKATLAQQIDEGRDVVVAQASVIRDGEKELQSLATELQQLEEKHDEASTRGAERERALHANASKVTSDVNHMAAANKDIEQYLKNDGPGVLARAQQAVQTIRSEIALMEAEHSELTNKVKKLEKGFSEHDQTRRSIDDNLSYRREQRALEIVKQEIEVLISRDAETEYQHYQAEGAHWHNEYNTLVARKASLVSSVTAKEEELKRRLEEYDTMYINVRQKYREAHVNVEATKACMDDIQRFTNALDQAIMKFHTIKMEEINRIIDELWRKTYQGTDVDTIYIRSDAEGTSNKNYNYRVCMLKQSTEMDMRGRCSAGQKVLACIIIRLALAECFGVHCGLIALDEPTTNLDRDNIEALAVSLAELINVRKSQKNFQLIIITHDEEFLKHMNPSSYVDSYYRVSRNSRQKSHIESEQISYLMRA